MSAGEWKELHRIYLINTENPCVGGSIPSLPTIKASIYPVLGLFYFKPFHSLQTLEKTSANQLLNLIKIQYPKIHIITFNPIVSLMIGKSISKAIGFTLLLIFKLSISTKTENVIAKYI